MVSLHWHRWQWINSHVTAETNQVNYNNDTPMTSRTRRHRDVVMTTAGSFHVELEVVNVESNGLPRPGSDHPLTVSLRVVPARVVRAGHVDSAYRCHDVISAHVDDRRRLIAGVASAADVADCAGNKSRRQTLWWTGTRILHTTADVIDLIVTRSNVGIHGYLKTTFPTVVSCLGLPIDSSLHLLWKPDYT